MLGAEGKEALQLFLGLFMSIHGPFPLSKLSCGLYPDIREICPQRQVAASYLGECLVASP
jgi:hypothetical protein